MVTNIERKLEIKKIKMLIMLIRICLFVRFISDFFFKKKESEVV